MKWIISFILFIPLFVVGQLQFAKVFNSNMVLQRDKPIKIYGHALPGWEIKVLFLGLTKTAVTQADSTWSVIFPKQKANGNSQLITIASHQQSVVLSNILMGDVWLCIGQSNMEFPVQNEMHFKQAVQEANNSAIRLYNSTFIGKYVFGVPFTDSMMERLNTNDFYSGNWQVCDSNYFKPMSAVGYYFATMIFKETNVPIGIINLAIGGCPLETFIRLDALKQSKMFNKKASGNWLNNNLLPTWVKLRATENIGNNKTLFKDELGPNHAYKPGFAYAAGIQPLINLPIKGVLLYQGESNSQEMERVNEYAGLQKLLINDYRKQWHQPDLPFYWVQLSSIDTLKYKSQLWPQFRDEQRKLLSAVKHSGMAVCSDIGALNNVHPTDKKTVGERLGRWALYNDYHTEIVPSGPLPLKAIYKNGIITIYFKYAEKGIFAANGDAIKGFSVNGKDEVKAVAKSNTVIIPIKQKPTFIYYGWKPYLDGNLINADSLPASTFKLIVQ